MKPQFLSQLISDTHYHHRVMATLIVSQLILLAVFRWWPQSEPEPLQFLTFDKEAIQVEEVIVTRQANAPAAPPKPQVPIPVPNDTFIEEDIEFPDLEQLVSFDSLSNSSTTGQTGDVERISGNPDQRPRIVRIVEPNISPEAKSANIKAMVFVNFTVNRKGDVVEALIAEIRLYEGTGEQYKVVSSLEYGVLPAVIEAAFKWKFRPAKEGDETVGAYTQDAFTIGF